MEHGRGYGWASRPGCFFSGDRVRHFDFYAPIMFRRATTCCIVTGQFITMIAAPQFGVNSGTAHNGINATLNQANAPIRAKVCSRSNYVFFKGCPRMELGTLRSLLSNPLDGVATQSFRGGGCQRLPVDNRPGTVLAGVAGTRCGGLLMYRAGKDSDRNS